MGARIIYKQQRRSQHSYASHTESNTHNLGAKLKYPGASHARSLARRRCEFANSLREKYLHNNTHTLACSVAARSQTYKALGAPVANSLAELYARRRISRCACAAKARNFLYVRDFCDCVCITLDDLHKMAIKCIRLDYKGLKYILHSSLLPTAAARGGRKIGLPTFN